MSRSPLVLGALVALLGLVPLVAAAQDLEDARERAEQAESALTDATERYEQIVAGIERASEDLAALERRADALEAESAQLQEGLADRARDAYMRGSTASLELLLAAEGPEVAVERAAMVEVVQHRGRAGLEEALATRQALDQTVALASERRAELEGLEDELAGLTTQLAAELEAAEATVTSLEQTAARQREIDAGSVSGTYACPLDPHLTHFVDSWGAPRSGGRAHQGTDVMGPMGAPVYAFTDGVISRHSNSRLGGISLYLRGDDGNVYFYTHLQGYAERGAVGTRVSAGEHIAYNGDTGNARGGPPHIHFEQHPGGGSAVNPYPALAAACF